MSVLPSGKGKCDNCGQLEESPSLMFFISVNDMKDNSSIRIKHFCRRNQCNLAILSDSPGLQGDDSDDAEEEVSPSQAEQPPDQSTDESDG